MHRCLRAFKAGAIVCNIGHFDNEIDTQHMRDRWHWQEVKEQVHQIFRSEIAPRLPNLVIRGSLG